MIDIDELKKKSKDEINKEIKALEKALEQNMTDIQKAVAAGDGELIMTVLKPARDSLEQRYRVTRGYVDILFFAYEYLSENKNPDFEQCVIPAGITIDMAPKFHQELCSELDTLTWNPTRRICWMAPRGSAKTTYLSEIKPLHSICYELKKNIVLISYTPEIAKPFLNYVRNALKFNKKIISDFGVLLHESARHNTEGDNTEYFVTTNQIKFRVSSIGKSLRGASFNGRRPDMLICDDLEKGGPDGNTNTESKRAELRSFFSAEAVPAMDKKRGAILYMGTLVHSEGLLPFVYNIPSFASKRFQSVINGPDHPELWDKYCQIYADRENGGQEAAAAFYEENKSAMDAGIEVLWPGQMSYSELMEYRVEYGTAAFNSEYQNIPNDSSALVFKDFQHFRDGDLYRTDGKRKRLDIVGFWDIALGKKTTKDGDYNAIVIVGKDTSTGILYVLEAWADKCTTLQGEQKVIEMAKKWAVKRFGIEGVAAQYNSYLRVKAEAPKQGCYHTTWIDVQPKGKKETRIEMLQPLFENGTIKIREEQGLLKEQLQAFPHGSHDDLPDALASAVTLSLKKTVRSYATQEEWERKNKR